MFNLLYLNFFYFNKFISDQVKEKTYYTTDMDLFTCNYNQQRCQRNTFLTKTIVFLKHINQYVIK